MFQSLFSVVCFCIFHRFSWRKLVFSTFIKRGFWRLCVSSRWFFWNLMSFIWLFLEFLWCLSRGSKINFRGIRGICQFCLGATDCKFWWFLDNDWWSRVSYWLFGRVGWLIAYFSAFHSCTSLCLLWLFRWATNKIVLIAVTNVVSFLTFSCFL